MKRPPNVFLQIFFSELRAKIDAHFGFNCFLNKIGTFALRSTWKALWNSSIREHTALTSCANSHIKNSTTCICFARNNVILSENCFLLHVFTAQVLILLRQEPALCGGQRKSITVFLCGVAEAINVVSQLEKRKCSVLVSGVVVWPFALGVWTAGELVKDSCGSLFSFV